MAIAAAWSTLAGGATLQADIWGMCPTCERWFRCVGWFDRSAPHPTCEHCGVEPIAIENRAVLAPVVADVPAR